MSHIKGNHDYILVLVLAIDFPGRKHNCNKKIRAQNSEVYRHNEISKSKSFITCLLTFRCRVQHLQSVGLQG